MIFGLALIKWKLRALPAVEEQSTTVRMCVSNYGSKRSWQSAKQLRNLRAGYSSKASTACQGTHDSQGNCVNSPQQIASVLKTHYAKLANPSEDAFLDDYQLFMEYSFQNWQVEGKEVFQPELDGELSAEELENAINNFPLYKAADSKDNTGEVIRNGRMELRALPLTLLNRVSAK